MNALVLLLALVAAAGRRARRRGPRRRRRRRFAGRSSAAFASCSKIRTRTDRGAASGTYLHGQLRESGDARRVDRRDDGPRRVPRCSSARRRKQTQAALDRAADFLTTHANVKRPADWDIDNVWGFVFGLQGAAHLLASGRFAGTPREAELKAAAATFVDGLDRYQSPNGGWAYYANADAGWRPEWATSFTTAAAVLALAEREGGGHQGVARDAREVRARRQEVPAADRRLHLFGLARSPPPAGRRGSTR